MIEKYRKKPIEVEAVQWTGDNYDEIVNLAKENCEFIYNSNDYYELYIETPRGRMQVGKGDFIVKDELGWLYPYKQEIFKKAFKKTGWLW